MLNKFPKKVFSDTRGNVQEATAHLLEGCFWHGQCQGIGEDMTHAGHSECWLSVLPQLTDAYLFD